MKAKQAHLIRSKFRKIPTSSLVLPFLIEFTIPGFTHYFKRKGYVLSFKEIDANAWFHEFAERVLSKVASRDYYPVMRFSDGEYNFLAGIQYPLRDGNSFASYFRGVLSTFKYKYIKPSLNASTAKGVSSGQYTREEIAEQKARSIACLKKIAEQGVMALQLNYGLTPFQEHYHRPFVEWLRRNEITFSDQNYYPFYFVYALLRGDYRKQLFTNRTVLVVHSAEGAKRAAIIESLMKEGVKSVEWCPISASRSMYDQLDVTPFAHADLALVGAGVGKFNILAQLEALSIPCIDAGFVFEVWADEAKKYQRTIMVPDSDAR